MRMVWPIALTMLALAGCQGLQEALQQQIEAVNRADHQSCVSQGHASGTYTYNQCRQAIADKRAADNERRNRGGSGVVLSKPDGSPGTLQTQNCKNTGVNSRGQATFKCGVTVK